MRGGGWRDGPAGPNASLWIHLVHCKRNSKYGWSPPYDNPRRKAVPSCCPDNVGRRLPTNHNVCRLVPQGFSPAVVVFLPPLFVLLLLEIRISFRMTLGAGIQVPSKVLANLHRPCIFDFGLQRVLRLGWHVNCSANSRCIDSKLRLFQTGCDSCRYLM